MFEAAETLFALQGYDATPVAQIGEAVGLEPGSLYNHIESKQELLRVIGVGAHQVLELAAIQAFARPANLRTAVFVHAHAYAATPWSLLALTRNLDWLEGSLADRVRATETDFRIRLVGLAGAEAAADMIMGAGPVLARRAIAEPWREPEDMAREHADLGLRLVGGQP